VCTCITKKVKTQKVGKYQYLQTPGLMALNFFSAVGIVVANKALFRRGGELGFATSLTGLHFIATAIGVRICHALGIYEAKHLTQLQARRFWCKVHVSTVAEYPPRVSVQIRAFVPSGWMNPRRRQSRQRERV